MADNHPTPNQTKSLDDSLLEVMSYVKYALKYLIGKWYIFLILISLGILWKLRERKVAKPEYIAHLSFIPNPNISLSSPADGLRLPGFDVLHAKDEELIGVVTSQIVLTEALFKTVPGREELLINELARNYFPDNFPGNEFVSNDIDQFTQTQIQYYKACLSLLKSNEEDYLRFFANKIKINSIRANTINPDLSLAIVRNVYDALSQFYDGDIKTKMNKGYNLIKTKRDSIYNLLNSYQVQLRKLQNVDGLSIKPTDIVKQERLSRNMEIAQEMYVQAEEELERQRGLIVTNEPTYRLVDVPIPPIGKRKLPKLYMDVIIGAAIGVAAALFVIAVIFLTTKFIFYYRRV